MKRLRAPWMQNCPARTCSASDNRPARRSAWRAGGSSVARQTWTAPSGIARAEGGKSHAWSRTATTDRSSTVRNTCATIGVDTEPPAPPHDLARDETVQDQRQTKQFLEQHHPDESPQFLIARQGDVDGCSGDERRRQSHEDRTKGDRDHAVPDQRDTQEREAPPDGEIHQVHEGVVDRPIATDDHQPAVSVRPPTREAVVVMDDPSRLPQQVYPVAPLPYLSGELDVVRDVPPEPLQSAHFLEDLPARDHRGSD